MSTLPEPSAHEAVAPPDPMSEACDRYFSEHWEMASFQLYVTLMAIERDQIERLQASALLEQGSLEDAHKKRAETVARQGIGAWAGLMTRQQMLLQTVLCRAVDNYLIYITDLLTLVFSTRPEMMKTSDQITYKDIVQFKEMSDLTGFMAERKVLSLAYKSTRDLADYLKKTCGFDLCEHQAELDRIASIIDVRNLIVHNRAVINRVFKDRQPDHPGKLGDVINLDMMQTMADIDYFAASVVDIEQRASAKWGYPRLVARKVHDERMAGLSRVLNLVEKGIKEIQTELESPSAGEP